MGEVFREITNSVSWLWTQRSTFFPDAFCIWILLILTMGGCCLPSLHANKKPYQDSERQAIASKDSFKQTNATTFKAHFRQLSNQLYTHIYWPLSIDGIIGGIACWIPSPTWLAWLLTIPAWILILLVLFVLISHARQSLNQLVSKMHLWAQKLSEHTFWNIAFWSICAIVLFFIFVAFLTNGNLNKLTDSESGPRLVTTAITMLGIITAAGALVMKYQDEQRKRAEEGRKNRDEQRNELSAALERMGSSGSAMARLAGVHTLVDVADKYEQYRAEVVRILCAYLRSNHSDDDPAIEYAVLESLQTHYANNKSSEHQWFHYDLDIHGATIRNPFVFNNCRFETVNLDNTTFTQDLQLTNCEFEELKTNNIEVHQIIYIRNITTQKPWHIGLAKETNFQRLTISKCRINLISTCNNSRIETFYIGNDNTIDTVAIGPNSEINTLTICYSSKIKKFCINSGTIGMMGISGGEINTFLIRNNSKIETLNTHNGRINTVKMYNGTINTLDVFSCNEIGIFDQMRGQIIHPEVPEDLIINHRK